MKLLLHWIFAVIVNLVALYAAATYISGFVLTGAWTDVLLVAVILAILNTILKPILKIFLGPIILLTLGIGMIFVYAAILHVLDIFSVHLTIQSVAALFEAGVLIGIINFVLHLIPL